MHLHKCERSCCLMRKHWTENGTEREMTNLQLHAANMLQQNHAAWRPLKHWSADSHMRLQVLHYFYICMHL